MDPDRLLAFGISRSRRILDLPEPVDCPVLETLEVLSNRVDKSLRISFASSKLFPLGMVGEPRVDDINVRSVSTSLLSFDTLEGFLLRELSLDCLSDSVSLPIRERWVPSRTTLRGGMALRVDSLELIISGLFLDESLRWSVRLESISFNGSF
jgi:hypothetical protein